MAVIAVLVDTNKPFDRVCMGVKQQIAASKNYHKRNIRYKKIKLMRWSGEDISDAKEMSLKLMSILNENGYCPVWSKNRTNCITLDLSIGNRIFNNDSQRGYALISSAVPNIHDEYNEWIGKCVCLCKAFDINIPEFILNH